MTIRTSITGLAVSLVLFTAPAVFATVTFNWVTIGSAGNAADANTGYGAVADDFRMATTEVTNAQYTEFLNAVASIDNFGGVDPNLYNPGMAGTFGGITQTLTAGLFSYTTIDARESNPVVYISFLDAMRFTNWLENGQGAGGTETGVYNITNGTTESRSPCAQFFLPTEDEWYKASYHQPAAQGGDIDGYWNYPTSSNSVPVAGVDANYNNVIGDTTPVGNYPVNFHGLFDMSGNVFEWNTGQPDNSSRAQRGGDWANSQFFMRAEDRLIATPTIETPLAGFRIASPVVALSCLGDINNDGIIDTADLGILLSQFGTSGSSIADLNGDCVVDTADLGILLSLFGTVCPVTE